MSSTFRFQIRRALDGRHRWYVYNASGTLVASHTAGSPSERDAYEDAVEAREALGMAPIMGEVVAPGATDQVGSSAHATGNA